MAARSGKYLLVFLVSALFCFGIPAAAAGGETDEVTHLWPLAAVHFDEPAPETATFAMSEEAFAAALAALDERVAAAYDALFATLPAERQPLLSTAQTAWQACCAAFAAPLKAQLDTPVKVFYGIEGEERKTNIYKDTMLAMREQRATDLEAWALGRFAYPAQDKRADNGAQALAEAEQELVVAFNANLYIADEKFRVPLMDGRDAWNAWQDADQALLAAITGDDKAVANAEALLQTERLCALTRLHREGSVFFHREREE